MWVFGELTGTNLDATSTSGVARMLQTSIFGVATGPASGSEVTVDVARFGLRDIAQFDFDVSGQVQADPDAFTVDVGGLATGNVDANSRLRFFGWISAVGSTGVDAEAASFVDRTNGPKLLFCRWAPPAGGVLDATGANEVVTIDVSQALIQIVADGFAPATLTDSPAPSLRPLLSIGIYRIVQPRPPDGLHAVLRVPERHHPAHAVSGGRRRRRVWHVRRRHADAVGAHRDRCARLMRWCGTVLTLVSRHSVRQTNNTRKPISVPAMRRMKP